VGRSRDIENLFIVDGSIFVTAARVNPTRTIQALALYVANNIKQRLATLFDCGEHVRGWREKATVCIPPAVGLG
jgi:choline dehydrogenase-like flavoprotein